MKLAVGKVKNIPGKTIDVKIIEELGTYPSGNDAVKFTQPVVFVGTVENIGRALVVKGNVSSTVELFCDRCGEPVFRQMKVPFEEVFTNQKDLGNEEQENEIHLFEGDKIDITEPVIQSIVLELPMKVLCMETCQGLCPECGTNLNQASCRCSSDFVDPRMMALKKLLNESSIEGGVINGSTEKKNLKGQ